jgi:hypothetical protein
VWFSFIADTYCYRTTVSFQVDNVRRLRYHQPGVIQSYQHFLTNLQMICKWRLDNGYEAAKSSLRNRGGKPWCLQFCRMWHDCWKSECVNLDIMSCIDNIGGFVMQCRRKLESLGKNHVLYHMRSDWESSPGPQVTGARSFHQCHSDNTPWRSIQYLTWLKVHFGLISISIKMPRLWAYEEMMIILGDATKYVKEMVTNSRI